MANKGYWIEVGRGRISSHFREYLAEPSQNPRENRCFSKSKIAFGNCICLSGGCPVVHCPRSNERLSCGRMPLEHFLSAGIPVYLGTDSRASSPSLDIREEAEYAKRIHHGIVDSDKIEAMVHTSFPSG